MPNLYLNPLSITYLVDSVLASILACYFFLPMFVKPESSQQRRLAVLLFVTFFAAALSIFLQFLSVSLHPDFAMYPLPWVGPTAAIAMAAFVLFAFYFQRPQTAGRLPENALIVAFALLVAGELTIAFLRHSLLATGTVEFRETWVRVPFAIGFLAAPVFFAGHLHRVLERDTGRGRAGAALRLLRALVWAPEGLSREAAAARAFFYVSIMPFSIGFVQSLKGLGLIDWSMTLLLACWLFLLTVAGFALAYMNYVPEQSSFRIKLVGVTLTAVLLILSGISWSIGSVYVDGYASTNPLREKTALHFEPNKTGGYDVRQASYQFDAERGDRIQNPAEPQPLPFEFPFYGKSYASLFPHLAGIVGFEHLPRWQDIQYRYGPQPAVFLVTTDLKGVASAGTAKSDDSGIFIKRERGRVVLTWNRLVSATQQDKEYTFQLLLYPSGELEMVFEDIPDDQVPDMFQPESIPMMTGIVPSFTGRTVAPLQIDQSLPFSGPPHQGIMQYRYLEFMAYLNRIYVPVAQFILASSMLVLIVFPRFFRTNLDLPLQQLIRGVQQILDGKLATTIEPRYRDEIGYLATSFNKMAKEQSGLIQSLESKVVERTKEATDIAARNARLEERNHLSQELHDAVSQTLFAANLIADTLPGLTENDPEKAETASREIRRLNKEALLEMRQLLVELRPERLSANRFGQLLHNIKSDIEQNHPIKVSMTIEGSALLPNEVLLAFFRVAQESLVNAAKHADASTIEVHFENGTDQALLSVKDDGTGFAQQATRPGSFGLKIMEERMFNIGGSLEVKSQPGHGSTITAIWFGGKSA